MTLLEFSGEAPIEFPSLLRPAGRRLAFAFTGPRLRIDGLTSRGWLSVVAASGEASGVVPGDASAIRCRIIGDGPASLSVES
jgi:hypothetical protein